MTDGGMDRLHDALLSLGQRIDQMHRDYAEENARAREERGIFHHRLDGLEGKVDCLNKSVQQGMILARAMKILAGLIVTAGAVIATLKGWWPWVQK